MQSVSSTKLSGGIQRVSSLQRQTGRRTKEGQLGGKERNNESTPLNSCPTAIFMATTADSAIYTD